MSDNLIIKLKPGDKAPDFQSKNQDDKEIKLTDYKGKKLILYFYPKDFTSGCTVEAENLRDNFQYWSDKAYSIVGVSPDECSKHFKFREKYNLPFDLIADTDLTIAKKYGVYGPKKLYGKEYMGILRTTFVIDETGLISEIIDKVQTKTHSDQLIKVLNL